MEDSEAFILSSQQPWLDSSWSVLCGFEVGAKEETRSLRMEDAMPMLLEQPLGD